MANKVKIKDEQGIQVYPITHVSAVLNDNGDNIGEIVSSKQNELVSGSNIKTVNGQSLLGSGNITIQGGSGGGGDVNVIESITFNGNAVPVDGNKNAAISYTAPVTSVNGNTGDVTVSVPTKVSDLTNDSGFISSYTETDPVFTESAAHGITSSDITNWNGKQDALTFNTTPSSSNKVATMADVPTTMAASGSGHAGGLVPDTPSTAGTSKFLREDGTWAEPAAGGSDIPVIISSASSLTIDPNKYYSFGTMASLTITLNSPVANVMNEYSFEFDSGSTATTLSIPNTVTGIDATKIAANKHYEVSIKYDASTTMYYGIIYEW